MKTPRYTAEFEEHMDGWIVRRDGVFVCSTRTEPWEGGDKHIGREDAEKIAALLQRVSPESEPTDD